MIELTGTPNPWFSATLNASRDLSEMLGIAKGVLADGVVNEQEAGFLYEWATSRPDVATAWPGSALVQRLRKIFRDGSVSEEERADLAQLLIELTGGNVGIVRSAEGSSTLPLD